MIYLISDKTKVKIGWSKNPQIRLKQLQTGNSLELRLVKVYDAPKVKERLIHRMLMIRRSRCQGEWFNLTETQAVELLDHWLLN